MTDEKTVVADNSSEIIKAGLEWIDGNAKKNEGAKEERNAVKKLNLLVKDGFVSVEINPHLMLDIGVQEVNDEEVDAKKLFEKNPEAFWAICNIPKTALNDMLGEAGAAKYMRGITKQTYKVKKRKV